MIYRPEHIQKHNKNGWLLLIGFLAITAIIFSVWFLQKRTQPNSKAAPSTTLVFAPQTKNASTGEDVSADIIVNPGQNQVSLVKIKLNYDGSKLQASSSASSIVVNQSAFPQTLVTPFTECNGTQCSITATFSIGQSPTNAIQASTTLATVHFLVMPNAEGTTQVTFDQETTAYSIGTADQASEKVLSSTSPLTINIGNVCHMNQSNCSWDGMPSAITYHYAVIEKETTTTIQEGDVNASQTGVSFPSLPGKTYTCTVTAASACGKGQAGAGTSTCPALTAIPTPSTTPSATPTICVTPGTVQNLHIICPNCTKQ